LTGLPMLPGVTELDLSGSMGLTSLAGIEKLSNLTTLNFSHTPLNSLVASTSCQISPRST
jgi:Leucine-rich repeat (LRR) protein